MELETQTKLPPVNYITRKHMPGTVEKKVQGSKKIILSKCHTMLRCLFHVGTLDGKMDNNINRGN